MTMSFKGKAGDSRAPNLPDDLMAAYSGMASQAEGWAGDAAGREKTLWNYAVDGTQSIQNQIPNYQNMVGGITGYTLGTAADLNQQGLDRAAYERMMLSGLQGIPQTVSSFGNQAFNPQMNYASRMNQIAPIYGNQDIINQQIEMSKILMGRGKDAPNQALPLAIIGNHVNEMGGELRNQLHPMRAEALHSLSEASQGRISPAIQQLFTDAGGTRERDILELQMNNARNKLTESASAQGGMLERNLAALETQRALGLAEQEGRRTNAQRQLAANLFGMATEQGISAPQQESALRGQAASIYDLAGKQQIGSVGQMYNNFGAAASLLQSAEQQRQSGLTGAINAMNTAADRDMAARQFQQQSWMARQELGQQLAQQYGAGGDALRLAYPTMAGQGLAMGYQGLTAPFLPAQSLGSIDFGSPMEYLTPAMEGYANLAGVKSQSVNERLKIDAERAAAETEGLGMMGGAAIGAMIMT